ncbi:unnamed protein product [Prorocentrum cordatum]|nr:unnamed protein product [Polarella glacialis]
MMPTSGPRTCAADLVGRLVRVEAKRLRESLGAELEEDDWDSYKDGFVSGMDGFEDVTEYHFVGYMTSVLVTVMAGSGGTQAELSPLQLRSLRKGDLVQVQRYRGEKQ